MNLDLSLASLVRASSGALMVAFGVYLLLVRPATLRSRALGAYHLALGPVFVGSNLLRPDDGALATWFLATVPLYLVAGIALLFLGWERSRQERTARFLFTATFILLFAVNVAAAFLIRSQQAGYDEGRPFFSAAYAAGPALLLAFAVVFRSVNDSTDRERLAFLAAGLAVYPVFYQAENVLLDPGMRAHGWATMVGFVLAALGWALVARGPASAHARNVSLLIAVAGLAGLGAGILGDDYGLLGVTRLVGVAILAYAVFQLDLLGAGLKPRAVRRGTVATVGLATLFIVAEIAQNFLSAQYGLLLGGVAAGSFLFAANPLQRAMERFAERPAPPAGVGAHRHSRAYRLAVRAAFAEGRLTPEKEVHLADLAEELGIGAGEALRIQRDVEAEARLAPAAATPEERGGSP